jgi:hypothetical protein
MSETVSYEHRQGGSYGANPFQETRNLNGQDQKLRQAGFEIVSRPKQGPDLWQQRGDPHHRRYTTEQALVIVEAKGRA